MKKSFLGRLVAKVRLGKRSEKISSKCVENNSEININLGKKGRPTASVEQGIDTSKDQPKKPKSTSFMGKNVRF